MNYESNESVATTEYVTAKSGDRVAIRTDKAAFDQIGAGTHHYDRGKNMRIGTFWYKTLGVSSKFASDEEVSLTDPNLRLWIDIDGEISFLDVKAGETIDSALEDLATKYVQA